ncbi:putative surface protein with fasciclin (FAS1) repeats [Roseibium hamelinense]|uniref:Putative surface protein with fasciclin (FAS1) repeats n=1 Tax=Roseibium hamelinense TaxID=150831 RepID=A0A562SY88_9HYPH|nr:fasciclin domain-containing protein [Roseibium hamelinense]MTI43616.1 DUF4214 domain-containing protein [Roseibium hamelinense]TWI86133.1 putative surface protein with fasciclin (FAS1) repeats [Roseibium hamelinense]
MASMTIAEIVAASGSGFDANTSDFNILRAALEAAGLTATLDSPSADLTVFAPTDAAFIALANSLGANVSDTDEEGAFNAIVSTLTELSGTNDPIPLLTDILLYHVSPTAKSLTEITNSSSIATTQAATLTPAGNSLVDIDTDLKDPSFVSGATDIAATNGTVHVIDRVLLPIDVPQAVADLTIADVVASSGGQFDSNGGDFDILLTALNTANLTDTFTDKTADFTVFAPTDDAFISLAQTLGANVQNGDEAGAFSAIVDTLTALDPNGDPIPLLTTILTYHVSSGGKTQAELLGLTEVSTLSGETLVVRPNHIVDKDPQVDNPSYISDLANLETQNGFVQPIDGVLLPLNVNEAIPVPDVTFDFDGNGAQLVRLYQAALGRAPDQEGFDHNQILLSGDMTLKQMASAFVQSTEFEQRFGANTSDEEYINALYNNVLARDADTGGLLEWDDRLDSGAWDRAEVLIGFAESPENQALTTDLVALFT